MKRTKTVLQQVEPVKYFCYDKEFLTQKFLTTQNLREVIKQDKSMLESIREWDGVRSHG